MKKAYVLMLTTVSLLLSCKSSKYTDLGDGIFADIQTTKGDIIVKLEHEKTPVTVANFVSLAEGTNPFVSDKYRERRYYDGIIFHRVIKDFMIQGGDPDGIGTGNPGYKFKDEFHDSLNHSKKGILSMANSGPRTNGSQFFITHKATPFLDHRHTVFGEVVAGMDVVDSIAGVKTYQEPNRKDKPVSEVVMNKVEIIRNGKEAKTFDAVQVMTDYFAEEAAKEEAFKNVKTDLAAEIVEQRARAETLPSGLKTLTIIQGDGEQPKIGQKVFVNYAGYLTDGTLFDSNYEEIAVKNNMFNEQRKQQSGYEPVAMDYSPEALIIAGFKEGLLSMKVGDKIRVFIPPHLGYGSEGYGPIPPNTELVFDLEITGIAE